MHPHGRVVGAPLIASHVGGDVSADLIATDFINQPGNSMLVDIGTNTELVVSDGSRILAASCPAGPAFEGGLLRHGMPGAEGAIESVRIEDGRFDIGVIGDVDAEGICGSGLVDILAELRRVGWMSEQGRFADGRDDYTVAAARNITFSRSDASELAQAKAANACGQVILLRQLGVAPLAIDRAFLAGGFANAVDVDNAIAIGFLAPVPSANVAARRQRGAAWCRDAADVACQAGRTGHAHRAYRTCRTRDRARLLRIVRGWLPVHALHGTQRRHRRGRPSRLTPAPGTRPHPRADRARR